MENMDSLYVPKWVLIMIRITTIVLIVWPKIPQMPQNFSAQAQKFWTSMKKSFIGRPYSVIMDVGSCKSC